MKRIKKKGSILVTFLMCFSILIIFGTAISSLAVSTLKSAKVQSVVEKNIYTAESGLGVVHSELLKVIQNAYIEGEKAVDKAIEKLILPSQNIKLNAFNKDEEINLKEVFKDEFKKYFKNNFNQSIFENPNMSYADISLGEFEEKMQMDNGKEVNYIVVPIKSTYKENEIEKTVSMDFEVYVPEFEKVIMYRNPVWSHALTTDGDIEINSKGKLSINGSVYAKGLEPAKKDNGIVYSTDNTVSINGNIYSLGNIYIKNGEFIGVTENSLDFQGNFYGANIINEIKNSGNPVSRKIEFNGTVNLTDDLEVNSDKTIMNFNKGLFAISAGGDTNKHNDSSSVIINGDGNNINIKEKLYIAGTSYIPGLYKEEGENLSPMDYQTGESISIKGNYFVYTDLLATGDENTDKDKYQWYYRNSDKSNGGFNLLKDTDKNIAVFNSYINKQDPYKLFANDNILILGDGTENSIEVYGLGAVTTISEGIVSKYNANGEIDSGKIYDKLFELKKNIYSLGNPDQYDVELLNDINNLQPTLIGELINFKEYLIIDGEVKEALSNSIVYSNSEVTYEPNKGLILVNNDRSKAIIITDDMGRKPVGNEIIVNVKEESIDGKKVTKLHGLIITNGIISIENKGNLDINGTIVSEQGINIANEGDLNINYNRKYIEDLISVNYENLEEVFFNDEFIANSDFKKQVITSTKANKKIQAKDFVKRKNWSVK